MEVEAPKSNPSPIQSQEETPNPQKSQEETPNPKRQKMSTTTTTSDDEDHNENAPDLPKKPRYKRRKIAIFFAYCGVGYQGMQKNPGAKTIEGDLEEALYQSGAIPEQDRGQSRRFDLARSARTDKGVSAVGQVVSGRFYIDPPGFIERLNSNLPPLIRIFGYKRTTASFNAKKFCDKRRYVYLIPVFALDPSCHRDRESVMASLGSGNELVKCLECSERGRKVFGVMGKRNRESEIAGETVEVGLGISSNSRRELGEEKSTSDSSGKNKSPVNDVWNNSSFGTDSVGIVQVEKTEENKNVSVDSAVSSNTFVETQIAVNPRDETADINNASCENGSILENGAAESEEREKDKVVGEEVIEQTNLEKKSKFHYGQVERERLNRILKYYEGTHNFHNFTTRMKADDPAAKRYIISFNANTTVHVDGIEFVKCEVVGQSFMLHQIRKMIGLAVAIMRNIAPESLIETAFQQKVNINVPMAPEVGLYLDECFFSSYNKKWKDSHEELSLEAYVEEAEDFKMKNIYSHIASTEHKDGVVALWLHSLNYRNFPDLRTANNVMSSDVDDDKAMDNVGPGDDIKSSDMEQ